MIPILIRKALLDETFEMYVTGASVRDYFYITDLAKAISGLLEHDAVNETVNVGSGQGTALIDLIHMVEEATDKPIRIEEKQADMPVVQSIVLNIEKLKTITGFEPGVSLREGIALETARIKKELNL